MIGSGEPEALPALERCTRDEGPGEDGFRLEAFCAENREKTGGEEEGWDVSGAMADFWDVGVGEDRAVPEFHGGRGLALFGPMAVPRAGTRSERELFIFDCSLGVEVLVLGTGGGGRLGGGRLPALWFSIGRVIEADKPVDDTILAFA